MVSQRVFRSHQIRCCLRLKLTRLLIFCRFCPIVAQSLNMPFVMLFVVFGGFLIPRSEVPDWLIWAYYLSPFSCQSHQRAGC
jgi:hypothetical protein